jgi:hypothetical protein
MKCTRFAEASKQDGGNTVKIARSLERLFGMQAPSHLQASTGYEAASNVGSVVIQGDSTYLPLLQTADRNNVEKRRGCRRWKENRARVRSRVLV